jgi:hypothetical protein
MKINAKEQPYLVNMLNQYKYDLASMVYAEQRGKDQDHWNMALSSLVQRIGKNEWRDKDIPTLLHEGYYGVSDTSVNKGWEWAQSRKFPNKEEENRFKEILAFTSRAIAGDIELYDNQFYFTESEKRKMRRRRKETGKGFNFDLVTKIGQVGDFSLYRYK